MTPAEIIQLKKLIIAMSLYYGQTLQDQVVALYAEDLSDLPFDRVVQVLKEVRRDPKTTRFPLPAVIRQRIAPEKRDPETEALEASNRIVEAVAKIGPYQSERARAFIGELGWLVVQREGGWMNLCETLTNDNQGMLKAQWRNLAKALWHRAELGQLDEAPALPSPAGSKPERGELQSFGNVMKQIADKREGGSS